MPIDFLPRTYKRPNIFRNSVSVWTFQNFVLDNLIKAFEILIV